MPIGIDTFRSISSLDLGRLKTDGDKLVSGKQSFLGRAIGIITGARQQENKAIYDSFKQALTDKYGDIGKDVLSSIKPGDRTRLSSATIKQVLVTTESLKHQYQSLGIPYNEKTRIGRCLDHNLTGPMKKLGSGAFNTVYLGKYKHPGGKVIGGVFKKEVAGGGGWVASMTGINMKNPQLGMRNIATYQLNKMLGFNVIPSTEFGAHGGELGVVMGLAPGTSPSKSHTFEITSERVKNTRLARLAEPKFQAQLMKMTPGELKGNAEYFGLEELRFDGKRLIAKGDVQVKLDFKDPTLRKELNKLQWMDALCGQGDRHCGNYFVERGANGHVTRVTGIDNDQSFGEALHDPNGIMYKPDFLHNGFRGCHMPTIIDRETVEAFKLLTPEKIEETLTGLLTGDEISACKDRLQAIKVQIGTLETNGKVINPDQWGGELATQSLLDKDSSYVARDNKRINHLLFEYGEVVK